jgi:PAS domain S-box-containing protein
MTSPARPDRLRNRADELVRRREASLPPDVRSLSADDAQRVIHELRVHETELGLQNEELLRLQGELEALRARYFDFFQLAPVGYLILATDGSILEVNQAASDLLGIPRAGLIGQRITRYVVQDDQDAYYLHRRRLHGADVPHACELRMVRADGSIFPVLLTASAAGDAGTIRVVLTDIGDRRRLEAERATLLVELEAARRAGEFASATPR